MRIVMYRVGIHREVYHVDGSCPSLTGRLGTVDAWGAVPEEEALREPLGLRPCERCAKEPGRG